MKALRNILRALFPARLRELTYPWRERLGRIPPQLRRRSARPAAPALEPEPAEHLTVFEKRIFSQNGEDGIIAAIFAVIGTTDRYFVEFGVEDGAVCNTALLLRQGWKGLQMDSRDGNLPRIKREFVSAENISTLFDKYGVPNVFDLLSIDIDGNDFWV